MLSRIRSGNPDNIDYVLVYKLSRFGRNAADALSSLKKMQRYGVELKCAAEPIDSAGPYGGFMITMMSAVAEIERENILIQTMAGRMQKAREGKWNGGQAPFGYRLKDGILEIDEEEAKIVRLIYDQYVFHQEGIHGVAKWLDDNGYRKTTRGNGKYTLFSAHTVKTILDNPVYTGKIAYGRRRVERVPVPGEDDEEEVVRRIKNDTYELFDGKHEAIISQDLWDDAHKKRIATGIGHEKTHSLDHEHILSGILKCPVCGASMYGTVNRKKKKDGSGYYKDGWYYVCKHRKLIDGEKCTYKKQPPQDPINNEVLAILASFYDYEGNEAVMEGVMGQKTDTDVIYKRIDGLEKQKTRKIAAKDRLTTQIDNLDPDDPNYDMIYEDLDERLRKAYVEIANIGKQLDEAHRDLQSDVDAAFTRMTAMEMLKAISEKIWEMTDAEKKEICQATLERVELFPERQEDGRYVKMVKFRFPVMDIVEGDDPDQINYWYNGNPVETVVLLRRKKVDTYVKIDLETAQLSSAAGAYATYPEIKAFVQEKFGLNVSSLFIAQVKTKLGMEKRQNYNLGADGHRVPQCPPEKEAAILDAFRHFGMIPEKKASPTPNNMESGKRLFCVIMQILKLSLCLLHRCLRYFLRCRFVRHIFLSFPK